MAVNSVHLQHLQHLQSIAGGHLGSLEKGSLPGVQNFFVVRYRSILTADLSNKTRMSYFF